MQLRSLAILLGLGLLAVSQCSDGRHAMRARRGADDDDIFAADEASEDEPQNDELLDGTAEPQNQPPAALASIVTSPRVYEVKQGDDISLECQIDPENATVVTQWYKGNDMYFMNTMRLDENLTRYYVAPESKNLNIKAVKPSDSGSFRCVVVQEPAASVEHRLVVLEPPHITRFVATNGGKVVEGQDLLLTCEVTGTPPPQIIWSRITYGQTENERLTETHGEFSPNSLFMRSVTRDQSGVYYCYVCTPHHDFSCDTRELGVEIAGKPHVHVHKTVVNSAVGVQAVLDCSTRYDVNPHIRWYKDGKLIEDSSTDYSISTHGTASNLTVTPKTENDFGTFTCEAENELGRHNRSISLVQRPLVGALEAEDGRLAWRVHSHLPLREMVVQLQAIGEGSDGTWKDLTIPLPSTSSHSYRLSYDLGDKLDAGRYQAVVKVRNDHSWSEDIEPVIVEIEVQPSMSIQTASVFRGNSAHSLQATSALSTVLMYLLVRTL